MTSIIAEAEGVYDICTVAVNRADTTVVLSSSAETLTVGDTVTLSATVASTDTVNSVVWRSMDTAVATVDQTGVVSAKSAGTSVIVAEADGAYGVCGISVINKESREIQPVPTASPAPSTTPSASPSNDINGDEMDEPSPIESATADAAEIPDTNDNTVTPQKVEESSGDPKVVIVTIKVSDLPVGTSSVRTAGGEEIIISGDGTLKMEVGRDELGADGALEIVALNAEGTPLAAVNVQIEPDRSAEAPVQLGLVVLLWVLIGLVVGIGISFGAFMLRNKKR